MAAALKASEIDALVLLPGPNLYYTLGITQMLRKRPIIYVVFPDGSLARVAAPAGGAGLPDRYADARVVSWTDAEGRKRRPRRWAADPGASRRRGTPRVAAEHFTLRLFERGLPLGGLAGTEFEPAEEFLDSLRMVKDPEDVEAMRQACRIAEESLRRVMERLSAAG